jgi:hypothetical protein
MRPESDEIYVERVNVSIIHNNIKKNVIHPYSFSFDGHSIANEDINNNGRSNRRLKSPGFTTENPPILNPWKPKSSGINSIRKIYLISDKIKRINVSLVNATKNDSISLILRRAKRGISMISGAESVGIILVSIVESRVKVIKLERGSIYGALKIISWI